jgi:predicted ATPase
VLLSESLRHIKRGDAARRLAFPHSAKEWRDDVVVGRRAGTAFISTSGSGDERTVKIHQDGGSRGQPKIASAARAPATVVSTTTQADDPTILSARREMQSWRRLALEPAAMRAPDDFNDRQVIEPNGRHLASALYRVGHEASDPDQVYGRVAARLAALTGLGVQSVAVEEDEARETLTLVLSERNLQVPARSLSEGTLRFLALCVLLEDPAVVGLLCMEEPENGIHPANLPAMVQLMQDLAVDPHSPVGLGNPFRQVIINTHSPGVVQLIRPDDLLFADARPLSPGLAPRLRLRPMFDTWRAEADQPYGPPIGKADLVQYLTAPPGAQLTLHLEGSSGPG